MEEPDMNEINTTTLADFATAVRADAAITDAIQHSPNSNNLAAQSS
jgi:hypothetical protein